MAKLLALLAGLASLLMPVAASAAEAPSGGSGGGSEAIFIVQLILLLIVGRLLGELMERIKQPAIIGQLLAGIVLGPSIFGALWPQAHDFVFPASPQQKGMLDAISQLGVLLILMLTGMETDLGLVKRVGRSAVIVSIAGVALPFACGFALGQFLPDALLPDGGHRLIGSLFLGTALSISSVKIVALVVRELNFLRRDIGQIIVASSVIEDTIGWTIIAITFGLASNATLDVKPLVLSIVGTGLFLFVSLTVGRRLMFLVIRWANDSLVSEFAVITAVIVVMGGMALITNLIGVHTVLGAFVAGILIGESPILVRRIDQQLRGIITALFMPVFFGVAGLGADLSILKSPQLALLTLGLVAIASIGKFSGAFVGGKIGGLTTREATALGCAMNARGSTEVIVATIGLSMGMLSQNLFTMILAMAIITTTAMPPMLRWALLRLPMRKSERIRLAREEVDKKSFVAQLERLLLAVDESANGKFASRLAGLVAGFRGMPVTVLHLKPNERAERNGNGSAPSPAETKKVERAVAGAANDSAKSTEADEHEPEPKKVAITLRLDTEHPPTAIAEEARKGHDLLWIGMKSPLGRGGELSKGVASVASQFNDLVAFVIGRNHHLENPADGKTHMLVPVDGTETSRIAVEVACIIGRTAETPITAIYVNNGAAAGGRSRAATSDAANRQAKAVVDDVAKLGQRHGVKLKTIVRAKSPAQDAILHELREGGYDLVLMGVSRLPGEARFLGETAAAIFEKSNQSVVLISGPRMTTEATNESGAAQKS